MIGPNELATSPGSFTAPSASNSFLLGSILGRTSPVPLAGTTVYVDDSAMIHVKALTSDQIGNEGGDFVLNSSVEGIVWDDALDIVKKHFLDAVDNGILPLGGHTPTGKRKIDGSKAENVFGIKYRNFEEQVVGLVGQYVQLVEKSIKEVKNVGKVKTFRRLAC